jgi:uncharacterized membrane protein
VPDVAWGDEYTDSNYIHHRPVVVAGVILGVGFGGFVDGIVLHQMLQWHHMLTAYDHDHYPMTTVDGFEVNTLWDGIFHNAMWTAAVLGLGALWWAAGVPSVRWSPLALVGAMLAGWGGFNLVEGTVHHQILGIHHVRDDLGGQLSWDIGFPGIGRCACDRRLPDGPRRSTVPLMTAAAAGRKYRALIRNARGRSLDLSKSARLPRGCDAHFGGASAVEKHSSGPLGAQRRSRSASLWLDSARSR